MTLTPTPHLIKAIRPCARRTGLKFSSQAPVVAIADAATFNADAPSAKLTININAFNGNKTNFGKK
jgi:hypothetical protein